MTFDIAFDRLIGNEGGYVHSPFDPGGETMWGVTATVARGAGYKGAMADMPRNEAKRIYRLLYWDKVSGDTLPPGLAFQVFDAAVNHGVGQAVKWLQAAAGAAQDGVIGPVTLGAVARANPIVLLLLFMSARTLFYPKLATFSTFGAGWTNRIGNNLKHAAKDVQ
jgi:lysozyme family protein